MAKFLSSESHVLLDGFHKLLVLQKIKTKMQSIPIYTKKWTEIRLAFWPSFVKMSKIFF